MDNNFNGQFNNQNIQNNAGVLGNQQPMSSNYNVGQTVNYQQSSIKPQNNQSSNTNFQSVNSNLGQPIPNPNANNNIAYQMGSNNSNPIKPKKFNVWLMIIPITVIVVGVFLLTNQDKKEDVNNNDSSVEKNDTNNQEDNILGSVEEEPNTNYDFILNVQTVFQVGDRGTLVGGVIEKGTIKEGDIVQIIGNNKEKIYAKVEDIEISSNLVEEAVVGEDVGIFLRNITKEQVEIGQQLVK